MKPAPIVTAQVCSVCGMAWSAHVSADTPEPTLEDCVRVLKDALTIARSQAQVLNWPSTIVQQPLSSCPYCNLPPGQCRGHNICAGEITP